MRAPPTRLLWPVFWLSCGILGFEITLMRVLLYASWHHFAFLVISVVLLGFGTSGTVLSFLRDPLESYGEKALFYLVLAAAVSMPLSLAVANVIPVEARFVPALMARQISAWVVYWLILATPFLLGATAIGLALILSGDRVPTVYAANLLGSGVGAVVAVAAMVYVPPQWLATFMGVVAAMGLIVSRELRGLTGLAVVILVSSSVAVSLAISPPHITVDPYKYRSHVRRLEEEGTVRRIGLAFGPRAIIEAFEGNVFHDLPFLATGESPPPITAILIDGQGAGSLLRIRRTDEATVVDKTLMSLPYALLPPGPRVALLGETGGANIWLAHRMGAASVRVVQPNAHLVDMIREQGPGGGGAVLDLPGVDVAAAEPRHFVAHTRESFDLVQLSAMESWAVETGGVAGLTQDYLVTTEGLAECLGRLSPNGILAVGRGLQLPPRDNVKLSNTLLTALDRMGIEDPAGHIVVLRDYLAACTMIKRSPWSEDDVSQIRDLCRTRELTPVYFPGIEARELNRPDRLPGPDDSPGDWLHYAVTRLLSPEREAFVDEWAFDVRAPTDDRPFFANFTKLEAIGLLKEAFGELWTTRTELALLFVLTALVIIAALGLLLTVVPVIVIPRVRSSPGLGVTSLYFISIGLAYLMLEITALSRLIHLLGDPVLAGSAAIAGFLFFSGAGSLVSQWLGRSGNVRLKWWIALLVAMGLIEGAMIGPIGSGAGALPVAIRFILSLVVIAPLAFVMGFPMPTALRRLERHAPPLLPLAWGTNGFASVLAPPLATAIGMTIGYRWAGAMAMILYVISGLVFDRLPGRHR